MKKMLIASILASGVLAELFSPALAYDPLSRGLSIENRDGETILTTTLDQAECLSAIASSATILQPIREGGGVMSDRLKQGEYDITAFRTKGSSTWLRKAIGTDAARSFCGPLASKPGEIEMLLIAGPVKH